MIPPALVQAGEDPALRGAPLQVLVWLWGQLEPHAYRPMKVDALAAGLSVDRKTAMRALHVLVERGYLEEGPRQHQGVRAYRVLLDRRRTAS